MWAPRQTFPWETSLDPSEWAYGPVKPWACLYGITYHVKQLLSYTFCFYLKILFLVNYRLTERIMMFLVWKPRKASELHKRGQQAFIKLNRPGSETRSFTYFVYSARRVYSVCACVCVCVCLCMCVCVYKAVWTQEWHYILL